MKKTLILILPLIFMACESNSHSVEKTNNIDPVECTYDTKPNKEYPYGDMLTFPDCGKLVNGELQLSKKHLQNMSFKKGSETEFGLTTVYISYPFFDYPHVFYVTKKGKTQQMYFYDLGADYFEDGLARYLNSENKMGFVNSKLKVIISAKYDYATFFKNGVAIVSNGSHSEKVSDNPEEEYSHMVGGVWGAIDKKGTVIVPLKYASESEVEQVLKELKAPN